MFAPPVLLSYVLDAYIVVTCIYQPDLVWFAYAAGKNNFVVVMMMIYLYEIVVFIRLFV